MNLSNWFTRWHFSRLLLMYFYFIHPSYSFYSGWHFVLPIETKMSGLGFQSTYVLVFLPMDRRNVTIYRKLTELKVSWFRNVFLLTSISSKKWTKTRRILMKTNLFIFWKKPRLDNSFRNQLTFKAFITKL